METFPIGGIITLLVLLPNGLMIFYPPVNMDTTKPVGTQNFLQVFTITERIGQAGCFLIPFFYRITIKDFVDIAAIVVMIVAMLLYYAGWARYIHQGRSESLLYRPMMGIPLPMAVMPVIYFIAGALIIDSVWLFLSGLILGLGHITVSSINSKLKIIM